jgi:hypothetical protein
MPAIPRHRGTDAWPPAGLLLPPALAAAAGLAGAIALASLALAPARACAHDLVAGVSDHVDAFPGVAAGHTAQFLGVDFPP